jgi:hypothetical protein
MINSSFLFTQLEEEGGGLIKGKLTSQLKRKDPKNSQKSVFEKSGILLIMDYRCSWRAEKRVEVVDKNKIKNF